jgi:hypothetical protein
MSEKWKTIKLIDVFMHLENNPADGWLYLPPDYGRWTLQTEGVFSLDSVNSSPDSDEYLPKQAKCDGWIATLDIDTIKSIIYNFTASYNKVPTAEERLKAFKYYFMNDAFM